MEPTPTKELQKVKQKHERETERQNRKGREASGVAVMKKWR